MLGSQFPRMVTIIMARAERDGPQEKDAGTWQGEVTAR